jgi:DNA-binding MarR family transcriptional regulator
MEHCLNFSMRKANRILNRIYDRHLQSCGLKGGQFTILRVINAYKQTTNSQLQEAMLIDKTTLSRNLKPLIRDGYISVTQGEDLRVKLLSLSPDGKNLFKDARKHWQQAQKEVKQKLGKDGTERLLEITGEVADLSC